MYERCMKYKCKACSEAKNCDLLERFQDILMYKPFENLREILENKHDGNQTR